MQRVIENQLILANKSSSTWKLTHNKGTFNDKPLTFFFNLCESHLHRTQRIRQYTEMTGNVKDQWVPYFLLSFNEKKEKDFCIVSI